ncbi:DUF202 domain-containing protein [Actinobaculum sp. 352]|uniref:DUF202 domain-containing protein n=1 Tax=Actinobaculum sp. 352 TaxID=2490946 RepID=UPI000F7F7D45|nr:DUF202 domain-containing protein [Actinobaculum sp. 352]RTE50813.1 hypothetical protein EKN07_01360 [Actinobaculum sp. 352]
MSWTSYSPDTSWLTKLGVALLAAGVTLLILVATTGRGSWEAGAVLAVVGLCSLFAGLYRQRRRRQDGEYSTAP